VNLFSQIFAEAKHRWVHTLLLFGALLCASALPVAFHSTGAAAQRETSRLMRDLGYNLRILPKDAALASYWAQGFADGSIPEDAVQRFTTADELSYNHLLALLVGRVDFRGASLLLTGLTAEVAPETKKKGSMIFEVEPGTIHFGFTAAMGAKTGEEITLKGKSFIIAAVLSESGTIDDSRAWVHLSDAQALLDMPGVVNEIQALECYCKDVGVDNLARLREELKGIVPEGQVLRMDAMAETREKQRRLSEEYFELVLPWVLGACAAVVALLSTINVRERRAEIGILRALGHGSPMIASLFLFKAVAVGLTAAIAGFALGSWLALTYGPAVFPETAGKIAVEWQLLTYAAIALPLFAAFSALPSTLFAVSQDPADSLREEGP